MPRIIYEITATVRTDLWTAYEAYMRERHIPDLMKTGYFTCASFSRSEEGRYQVRYEAASREALVEYIRVAAPGLREHLAETFPEGVEISREEWEILADFAS